jgi:S-phase kinase-associated protein 1
MTSQVILISSDGQEFEADAEVVRSSLSVIHKKNIVSEDNTVHVSKASASAFATVIEFSKTGGATFCKENVSVFMWMEIVIAADLLGVNSLLDIACAEIARMVKGKTPDQMREMLNIIDDLMPEEEAEIHRENPWAYDD